MSVPRDVLNADQGLRSWCILHGYRGSIAHGTYEPSSEPTSIDDKDTMAVCVPGPSWYYGLKEYGSRGTQEIKHGEWDIVIYEARKFVRLMVQGNPNVLSLLWLPTNLYVTVEPAGQLLIDHRHLFAARHVHKAFAGYAASQLQKMERHACKGYMGEKRKQLVERFGYDTKNAAHLIRLLRQGIEFLSTGELLVQRPDAAQLLAIKHGEWTLEQVKAEAEVLFAQSRDALVSSPLPLQPDAEAINSLCVEVVQEAMRS